MRVVFMGTPDFAVPTLLAIAREHRVVAVFSQPDRPAGRGKKMRASAVKRAAQQLDLPVYQPQDVNSIDSYRQLKVLAADVVVVVAYGQILKRALLDLPQYGCLNVHASLLPRWRGASPIQSAIVAGDRQSGVTIMQMDSGLDSGAILAATELPIDDAMTAGQLHDQLMQRGADLLVETLAKLPAGGVKGQPQDEALATYAPRIDKQSGQIDWRQDAVTIVNLIRGYNPWPSAQTSLAGKTIKLHRATALQTTPQAAPGCIERIDDDYIYVSCGRGVVRLEEIQPQNKKRMTVAAYLRGHRLVVGSCLQSNGRTSCQA